MAILYICPNLLHVQCQEWTSRQTDNDVSARTQFIKHATQGQGAIKGKAMRVYGQGVCGPSLYLQLNSAVNFNSSKNSLLKPRQQARDLNIHSFGP